MDYIISKIFSKNCKEIVSKISSIQKCHIFDHEIKIIRERIMEIRKMCNDY